MGIGDIRFTVLQVVNEVQRKLGLDPTSTLSANKLAKQMVDFVNDVCDDLSDFGNWQEVLTSTNVTAVSGQRDYSIATSANIKNIGDIFFSTRTGPLRNITIQDMRIFTRTTITGTPTQFTVFGTDANGNPLLRVRPTPAANEDGELFSIIYYVRPPSYTTADNNTLIPFPGQLVTQGVLAKAILNESEGAPNDRYTATYQEYLAARKEALNRFNGDTGWDVSFTPSLAGRRRRC
jgi:hypothetical protein